MVRVGVTACHTATLRKGNKMRLQGKKILIFCAQDFEDMELHYPRLMLQGEGAEITLAGLDEQPVKGKHGVPAKPDTTVDQCQAEQFDAIVIPGTGQPSCRVWPDRKSTRLNSSHSQISYAVFC